MSIKSKFQELNDWTGGLLVAAILGGISFLIYYVQTSETMSNRMTAVEVSVDGVKEDVEDIKEKLNDSSLSGFATRREMESQRALLESELRYRTSRTPPVTAAPDSWPE